MGARQPTTAAVQHRRTPRRGFTLIETALTTVIVGVGVLALIEAQQAFLRTTAWSSHSATATYLANEIRELTRKLPRHDPVTGIYLTPDGVLRGWGPEPGEVTVQDFDDIDDFDGIRFSFEGTPDAADGDLPGPIDAFGTVIPEVLNDGRVRTDANGNPKPLQGWAQVVRVQKVHPFNTAQVMGQGDVIPPNPPDFDGVAVHQFPLRVTVQVRYRGPYDTVEQTVATVVWIVP